MVPLLVAGISLDIMIVKSIVQFEDTHLGLGTLILKLY